MKRQLLLTVLFALLLLLPRTSLADEIIVSAAASLTNAFTDLKTLYEKAHPGTTVHLNFAASTPLLKQIQEGAPVDVFASADQETMDAAAKAKVINEKSRKDFVRNTLVLIIPKDGKKPTTLNDITGYTRLAIGNPDSVPAGRYTKQALIKAGLWDKSQKIAILGTNVRQVLDYVARGEVDAGFVYGTDAKKQADKVESVLVLDGHKPILYPIAQVTTGNNAKGGQDFLNFVVSEQGMSVLNKYGFARP
ncbi:MAG: molybdate ABC transporter substrate-binding protein [Desulfovibrio sp.]|nr:molybdate ABC transporter substrate-binding protein [Desulfovibrio sp.]